MKRSKAILLLCIFLGGCATGRQAFQPFNVILEVDFGLAHKPALHQTVQVQPGATAGVLTAQVCSVEKGAVCCDSREIAAIDGVASDPAMNRWWTLSINGSKKVSPFKTRLKPGDLVRWEYRQYEQ